MPYSKTLPPFMLAASIILLTGCIESSDAGEAAGLSNPMTTQEINDFIIAINDYRANGATCGSKGAFGKQEPLTWNQKVAQAAQAHSDDQFEMNQMSHTGSDGSGADDRINRQGYEWQSIRENVAAGYFTSVEHLAEAWMGSDGHCVNMMASDVTELGIAATREDSGRGYWTLKLAQPRD
ncbi:CAP domain-containing protein [Marinospirillum sp.]|uniref:CAP domain-containing protein n=1 Tax=Marinospirillum sp. TaxID=2183934 RepID=UPI00384AF506